LGVLFGDIKKNSSERVGVSGQHELVELANAKMPFGKYQGRFLINLPEYYLVWYKNKGFPAGKLGRQLELVLELKVNGLENLIYPLIKNNSSYK